MYQRIRNEEDAEEWMVIRTIENTSSLEFVVKELEKGKEYQFLITARNTYGESLKKGYCKRVQVPGGRYRIALLILLAYSQPRIKSLLKLKKMQNV